MTLPRAAVSSPKPAIPWCVRRRPQLVAELVVLSTWVALVALHAGPRHQPVPGSLHAYLHATPTVIATAATSPFAAIVVGLPGWTLMSAAMMVPAAIPAARHVAVNSLRRRRHRAVGEFLATYLSVWVLFGAVVLPALWQWPVPRVFALAPALVLAAGWQFTPWHGHFVSDCHRTIPLPPTGRAAVRGTTGFGAKYGLACLGSCWALMLVMAVAVTHHLVWTAVLGFAVAVEKNLIQPRRTARVLGTLLAVAGGFALFV